MVLIISLLAFVLIGVSADSSHDTEEASQLFHINGKVTVPNSLEVDDWMSGVTINVEGGLYKGFIRNDGSFTVNNLVSGSYVVEVIHPTYAFEPVRVDINSKGKIRARRLNNMQMNAVQNVAYPLRLKSVGLRGYFAQREQWRIKDLLLNPMVIMMLLPMVFIFLMPKLINTQDPETQRELQSMNLFGGGGGGRNNQSFDLAQMCTSIFSGGATTQRPSKDKRKSNRS